MANMLTEIDIKRVMDNGTTSKVNVCFQLLIFATWKAMFYWKWKTYVRGNLGKFNIWKQYHLNLFSIPLPMKKNLPLENIGKELN